MLARVQDRNLDDPGEAEAALRKILEFDPTNASALDAMAQMFGRRGRDRELIVSLEQKLEAAPSIEARKAILREISRIYLERLKDVDEAANALIRALELEPDVETLGELARLYREQHMWGDLAATLARTRDLLPTSEERARMQVEVAEVQEREIGDEEAAVEAYREALELDPRNRRRWTALERLYTRLDRPADLLAIYERQLELTEDYREKVKHPLPLRGHLGGPLPERGQRRRLHRRRPGARPHQPPGDQGAGAAAAGAGTVGGPGGRARAPHPARHRCPGAGRPHGGGRRGAPDAPPPDRQGG